MPWSIEMDYLIALASTRLCRELPHNLQKPTPNIMSDELANAIVTASEKMHRKDPQNLSNAVATVHKAGMYYKILSLDSSLDISGNCKFLYIEECIGHMKTKGFDLLEGKDSDVVLDSINALYKKGHDGSRAIAAFGRA